MAERQFCKLNVEGSTPSVGLNLSGGGRNSQKVFPKRHRPITKLVFISIKLVVVKLKR